MNCSTCSRCGGGSAATSASGCSGCRSGSLCGGIVGMGGFSCIINLVIIIAVLEFLSDLLCNSSCG